MNKLEYDVLIDTISGISFALDTSQQIITAINHNGDTLWQTTPSTNLNVQEYRIKNPKIVYYNFKQDEFQNNKEVIWVIFQNTQFGVIDKETGKYIMYGQD